MTKCILSYKCVVGLTFGNRVILDIDRIKDKCHMIISANAEKLFKKSQTPFQYKNTKKLGIQRIFLNWIQGIYEKSTTGIIINGEY